MRRAFGLGLVISVLAAAPAGAKIVRAEAILPPGQSGHVSITGVTSGTGSPHLYDQQQPFIEFKRKPFGFTTAGDKEEPRDGVTILRDNYGVPAITGRTDYDMWWGAGYAVAQDRLFELELFRRATTGRLAEILGRGYLDDDLIARRDYYTAAELDDMAARQASGELRMRAEAYRDGINAWIAQVRMNPGDMPGEFVALAVNLVDWTVRDSIAVGVFLARTVPSGDGNELNNLRALQKRGPDVLDALLPLRIKGQVATIPRSDGLFAQGRAQSRKAERAAFRRSIAFAKTLPPERMTESPPGRAEVAPGMIGRTGGSYMFAVRGKGRRAWLFNGPQLGFAVPELFVELELHGPGFDVRGVTAPGVPVIGIGHNQHVAWGFTSGLSDEDDLYAEKLVAGQDEKYVFEGAEREMECRDEVFNFRSAPTDLLGGAAPELGSVTERICRTVHGPVQHARRGRGVRPPLCDLGPRARDVHRHREAQRRRLCSRRGRRDARRHLERERHGRRRRRQHRLLASRPRADPALGVGPAPAAAGHR